VARAKQVAVAEVLLQYGIRHASENKDIPIAFTTNPEADELVRDDPFAFLLAVIFDQGIPSERAWMSPFLLRERLGFLDPLGIASNEAAVSKAIGRPPSLHRYVNTMPGWIVKAADRVLDSYGGDAGRIWCDNPSADDLQKRFCDFVGIAQKKAAMAVITLERDLGVPIRNLHRSDIAFDVHIRRVFLRSGLADRDDQDHVVDMARRLNPAIPGALNLPTWLIGRGWCRPRVPDCVTCPLTEVCPKEIERAAGVTSG
jgi:uncharacterized HhH-GPD family protein